MTLETMGLGLNVCMHRPSDLTLQHTIHAIPFFLSRCRIFGSRFDVGNINLLHLLLRLPGQVHVVLLQLQLRKSCIWAGEERSAGLAQLTIACLQLLCRQVVRARVLSEA
jgi:hypothetical protein